MTLGKFLDFYRPKLSQIGNFRVLSAAFTQEDSESQPANSLSIKAPYNAILDVYASDDEEGDILIVVGEDDFEEAPTDGTLTLADLIESFDHIASGRLEWPIELTTTPAPSDDVENEIAIRIDFPVSMIGSDDENAVIYLLSC